VAVPFTEAVRVAVLSVVNTLVVKTKDVCRAPAGTRTDPGIVTGLDPALRVTLVPPAGAGRVAVTKQFALIDGPSACAVH
jgi:hypothetical protein